jgi:hypothetical protein
MTDMADSWRPPRSLHVDVPHIFILPPLVGSNLVSLGTAMYQIFSITFSAKKIHLILFLMQLCYTMTDMADSWRPPRSLHVDVPHIFTLPTRPMSNLVSLGTA